MKRLTMKVRHS